MKTPPDDDSLNHGNDTEVWGEADKKNGITGFFQKKYPKLEKFFRKHSDDPRIDYTLNLMNVRLGELQHSNNSRSKMSKFFNQTLSHQILKAVVVQNFYKGIKFESNLVGTPLNEVLVAMGMPPALRTKQRIIDNAVGHGYLHRVAILSNLNMKALVPSDVFIVQHMIEMKARIELHLQQDTMAIATRIGEIYKDEKINWAAEIVQFLTEKQKTEIMFEKDIFD